MAYSELQLRIRFAWWVWGVYLPLTRFGYWLGLPINPKIVARDICRGVRFEIV